MVRDTQRGDGGARLKWTGGASKGLEHHVCAAHLRPAAAQTFLAAFFMAEMFLQYEDHASLIITTCTYIHTSTVWSPRRRPWY